MTREFRGVSSSMSLGYLRSLHSSHILPHILHNNRSLRNLKKSIA